MFNFLKGLFKENPIFVLALGLCPTLAVSTQVVNAIGMGAGVIFVLIGSNIMVSLLKNFIPDEVHIPAYIVIIASFVTIVDLLMQAFLPALSSSLGVFVKLIVVNCIILGRAEAFASKNNVKDSIVVTPCSGNGNRIYSGSAYYFTCKRSPGCRNDYAFPDGEFQRNNKNPRTIRCSGQNLQFISGGSAGYGISDGGIQLAVE